MPLFPAGPLPAPHLKEETPKGKGQEGGLEAQSPSSDNSPQPLLLRSPHYLSSLGPGTVPHVSWAGERKTSAAVYLEKRVWGRLGHGG